MKESKIRSIEQRAKQEGSNRQALEEKLVKIYQSYVNENEVSNPDTQIWSMVEFIKENFPSFLKSFPDGETKLTNGWLDIDKDNNIVYFQSGWPSLPSYEITNEAIKEVTPRRFL